MFQVTRYESSVSQTRGVRRLRTDDVIQIDRLIMPGLVRGSFTISKP